MFTTVGALSLLVNFAKFLVGFEVESARLPRSKIRSNPQSLGCRLELPSFLALSRHSRTGFLIGLGAGRPVLEGVENEGPSFCAKNLWELQDHSKARHRPGNLFESTAQAEAGPLGIGSSSGA